MNAPCSEIRVIICFGIAIYHRSRHSGAPNYGNGTAAIMVYEAR